MMDVDSMELIPAHHYPDGRHAADTDTHTCTVHSETLNTLISTPYGSCCGVIYNCTVMMYGICCGIIYNCTVMIYHACYDIPLACIRAHDHASPMAAVLQGQCGIYSLFLPILFSDAHTRKNVKKVNTSWQLRPMSIDLLVSIIFTPGNYGGSTFHPCDWRRIRRKRLRKQRPCWTGYDCHRGSALVYIIWTPSVDGYHTHWHTLSFCISGKAVW